MSKFDIDGHVWWAPTRKLGGGWILHKDSPSAPQAPDPEKVSAAQTASNIDTARLNARLNRVNQVTPWGNLTYSQKPATFDEAGYQKALAAYNAQSQTSATPGYSYGTTAGGQDNDWGQSQAMAGGSPVQSAGAGQMPTREQFMVPSDEWEARVTLSEDQQRLLDQDSQIKQRLSELGIQGLDRVGQTMGQAFDTSGMTAYQVVPTAGGARGYDASGLPGYRSGVGSSLGIQGRLPNSDYAAQRQSVEDAIYSRLNPQLQRDRAALDQRLANQGIMPGSEAYQTAIQLSDQQANDARMQAILAGGQEQSRLAGLDLQAGQFANNAQAQDFSQQMQNAGLFNLARQQLFGEGMSAQELANTASQQNFSQGVTAAQLAAALRQQQVEEEAYKRNLPLQELNALRSGSQVQAPQFSGTPQVNVAGTDAGGNIWNSYKADLGNYNAQVSANNQFNSGLMSLGSTAAQIYF